MSNPFVLDVHEVLEQIGAPEHVQTSGNTPLILGGEMLAIPADHEVTIDAFLTNLGEAVLVDGTVTGSAHVTCSLCLREFETPLEVKINTVFGKSADFFTDSSDDEDELDDDESPQIVEDERVDITQNVVDEAGLNAPFSPVCADFDLVCSEAVPAPDGISEDVLAGQAEKVDPRWAGLAKFQNLGSEDTQGTDDSDDEGDPQSGDTK